LEVFRLVRAAYADGISGKGAAIKGARWNSQGIEMIYTAENRSLAMAEVAVHFSLGTLPSDYRMMTIYIPNDLKFKNLSFSQLHERWNDFPPHPFTKKLGDQFVLENQYAVLRVPSVVVQGDFNLLINPHHTDIDRLRVVEIVPFPFDRRIFQDVR